MDWNKCILGEKLTPRQRQVALLVSKALTNKEIATALHMASDTVKNHLYAVLVKTGCRNRVEVALLFHNAKEL